MRTKTLIIGCVLLVVVSLQAHAREDSGALGKLNQLYGKLLASHTEPGVKDGLNARMVHYKALAKDPQWFELVKQLERFPLDELRDRSERMAFYLNAYNILAVKKVQENWPLRNLRSLGSLIRPVWKHDAGVVGGEAVTLSYLEHDVLRAMGDPRVHVAINCASMSCPDLREEPYEASRLDEQLDDQARRFLQQEAKGILVDESAGIVRLSSIFDWFEEDFEQDGGVASFIRRYRPDINGEYALQADLPYNWDVNAELTGKDLRTLRAGL